MMNPSKPIILIAAILFALFLAGCAPGTRDRYDLVLQGGRVMDPETGLDAVRSVGIRNGRIEQISENTLAGERIIDATGLVVAPGFIDMHAHGQTEEAFRLFAQDGVTTALELESGTGDIPSWYAERESGQILNYGVSIGHIKVRMEVMGDSGEVMPTGPGASQAATEEQIGEMARLIEEGLREGAVAVGFGLAYTPAATTAEFKSMLRIAAAHGASSHIHIRGASSAVQIPSLDGLSEAIDSAARTGASLHVVHANSSGGGAIMEFLRTVEQARSNGQDVTTEAYPYEAGQTMIESAIFNGWESWEDDRFAMLQWAETGERLTRESFVRYRGQGGMVIIHSRTEDMTSIAIGNPLTMIATDGRIENGKGHPRASGTYAKVLGKYVREEGLLTLMDALRKMTIEPARRLESHVSAMRRKGRLQVGVDADITIFNPETVIDRSTYTDPAVPAEGIPYVLVNGVPVVDGGEVLPDTHPGRAVRAP